MSASRSKNIVLDTCQRLPSAESLLPLDARVVEWQTRTFEGRMPKGLRVQVPPRALSTKFDVRVECHALVKRADGGNVASLALPPCFS
jgi:hypothetical protein